MSENVNVEREPQRCCPAGPHSHDEPCAPSRVEGHAIANTGRTIPVSVVRKEAEVFVDSHFNPNTVRVGVRWRGFSASAQGSEMTTAALAEILDEALQTVTKMANDRLIELVGLAQ